MKESKKYFYKWGSYTAIGSLAMQHTLYQQTENINLNGNYTSILKFHSSSILDASNVVQRTQTGT